jgi:hypothetical protein
LSELTAKRAFKMLTRLRQLAGEYGVGEHEAF